jgi:hypothetical protein
MNLPEIPYVKEKYIGDHNKKGLCVYQFSHYIRCDKKILR